MASPHPDHHRPARRPAVDRGRDEMNLVEFPFATLSHRATLGSIHCERWVTDARGQRHRQLWTVQGGSASGLPTEFDERVYVALMAVTRQQGFRSAKVRFSVYGLLRIMGESTDNRHYRSVERSLERLLRVSIVAEGAFWDHEQHELVQILNGFHLIERYWLAYRERDHAVLAREGVPGYIVWGSELWRSIRQGYLKDLDLARFFALRTPVARRLYRFLDKKFHHAHTYEIDIFQLGQQLGMRRYRYPAKVREKLEPGIAELVAGGYLAGAEVVRVRGFTRLRFVRSTTKRPATPAEPAQHAVAQAPLAEAGRAWRRQAAQRWGVPEAQCAVWERALERVRGEVTGLCYRAWLARSLLWEVEGRRVTLLLPNGYTRDQVARRWDETLRRTLVAVLGHPCTVAYRTTGEGEAEDLPSGQGSGR